MLAGAFLGTAYFVYSTWVTTLFPQQKKRGGKGGERAKASSGGSKQVDPSDQVSVVGADGPAVMSGAKAYDESWIPAQHLRRPEAKRIRSGTPTVSDEFLRCSIGMCGVAKSIDANCTNACSSIRESRRRKPHDIASLALPIINIPRQQGHYRSKLRENRDN